MPGELLRGPTDDERKLLDVIMESYISHDVWPNYQYVEVMLFQQHGLEALPLLESCPRVQIRNGIGRYGWLRTSSSMYTQPQETDQIALSLSGMARSTRSHPDVNRFLAVLRLMCERQRAFYPSPTEVQTVRLESGEIQTMLSTWRDDGKRWPYGGAPWGPEFQDVRRLAQLIQEEPSTWNCAVEYSEGSFAITLSPFVRPYAGVADATDYVERLVAQIAPPPPLPPPAYPSGLALPEAIDYLNSVWRVHTKGPLFHIKRAEVAARLALECATPDEFETQLSGLCQVLDGPAVPDSEPTLIALNAYLEKRLDEGASARVHEAIETLRALFTLRAWRQHAADNRQWQAAARRLNVSLPTSDWSGAWRNVHLAVVTALGSIRQEVDGLEADQM